MTDLSAVKDSSIIGHPQLLARRSQIWDCRHPDIRDKLDGVETVDEFFEVDIRRRKNLLPSREKV